MARKQDKTLDKPKGRTGQDRRRRPAKKREVQRKGSKSRSKVIRYFQDTRDELRKVTWPTREETTRLTMIVLGTTVAFAVFLGLLDFVFQRLAGILVQT